MDEKALGHKLQLARKRAGLTQQELCQKAGLSYSTLAKIERGAIRSPSVFTVATIAHVTGTPLENLLEVPQAVATPGQSAKKRSKTGVTFVYCDINGTLVRFFHKAFAQISEQCGQPTDVVETIFWRHHDSIATGKLTMEEFNASFAKEVGLAQMDWRRSYMENVEPMPGIKELVDWTTENYQVGILSNNLPGFIDEMRQRGIIPDVDYKAVVDSSKTGLLKPDPRIFDKAQELAGVDGSEILLIDDTRPNLMAADRLGWKVVWFDDLNPQESIDRIKQALEF